VFEGMLKGQTPAGSSESAKLVSKSYLDLILAV
jgi:hypothetical protein